MNSDDRACGAAAAVAGDQQRAKTVAKLGAEQAVDDRVDGAAGQAEPLGERYDGPTEQVELTLVGDQRRTE